MAKVIEKAAALLPEKISAAVIYTTGTNLTFRPDGTGSISRVKMDKKAGIKKVVIYRRNKSGSKVTNTVYLGDVSEIGNADENGRRVISLNRVSEVGSTASNWFQFAEGTSNPVRYIGRG